MRFPFLYFVFDLVVQLYYLVCFGWLFDILDVWGKKVVKIVSVIEVVVWVIDELKVVGSGQTFEKVVS